MRAIRVHEFGGPEVLRLEETPALEPGPGELVITVRAVGVNPVDTYLRAGTHYKPKLPFTPGRDAAGTVAKVGAGAKRFKPGDRVYVSAGAGTYAEETVCAECEAHPLPAEASFEQGAALGVPYTTAYRALFGKARTVPGETVLVHGASGAVGLAAVQLARALGIDVLGTAGSPQGLELIAKEGVRAAFDHGQAGYVERIREACGGKGPAVILEMRAEANLAADLSLAAPGGRIVVIGCRGEARINPREAMSREISIFGMVVMNTPAGELARIHEELQAGLIGGSLRPVIRRSLPLHQAAEAHRAVLEPGACGKIVLIP